MQKNIISTVGLFLPFSTLLNISVVTLTSFIYNFANTSTAFNPLSLRSHFIFLPTIGFKCWLILSDIHYHLRKFLSNIEVFVSKMEALLITLYNYDIICVNETIQRR